jgi:hypothetical protein
MSSERQFIERSVASPPIVRHIVSAALATACIPFTVLAGPITSATAPLPFTMDVPCLEGQTCKIPGLRQVWYGAPNKWRYGVFENSVPCTNATFGDPFPGANKRCYHRSLQDAGVLPAKLEKLDAIFNAEELVNAQGGRYTVEFISGSNRRRVVAPYVAALMGKLPVPEPQDDTKSYFQFLITDTADIPVSYNVFVASTDERCLVQRVRSVSTMDFTFGRVMEMYSLIASPASTLLPFRSDLQKVCTADSGKLAFFFKPPSVDAYQVKVVSHDHAGNATGVMDLFIPTKPNHAPR